MKSVRALLAVVTLAALPAVGAPRAGKRISLDVSKAPVHDVLRLLADVGRVNLVAGEEVQGTVTLRLRDVPWTQALDVVLTARGLGSERRGNILRVAPLKQLLDEAETRARLAQAHVQVAPLRTWLIPVSYAQASDLLTHVRPLLSPRGSASVDARTNTLIVTDVEKPSLP